MSSKSIVLWAPSLSPGYGKPTAYDAANRNLSAIGVSTMWAPWARRALADSSKDLFDSMSIDSRIRDLTWALTQETSILLCAIGGYNAYQLLDSIDWSALKRKGATLVGHSDFTVLANAYYAKTGMVSWYGPNFRNFGDSDTGLMSVDNFVATLSQARTEWRSQRVYKNSFKSQVKKSAGWYAIRAGNASGIGIGGNVGTFFLLQGTQYMPKFNQPTILFLEEDEMPGVYAIREFDRKLRSILDQPGAQEQIKGLVIGRFLDETKTTRTMIKEVIDSIPFFDDKPVIANVEIGHGMPRIMLPIGGKIQISAPDKKIVVYNPLTGVL